MTQSSAFSIIENNKTLPWFLTGDALAVYKNPKRYLAVDFETNNFDKGSALNPNNHIVLACWDIVDEYGNVTRKHKWADEYGLAELEQDIAGVDFIIAHNAKFELQWLKRCGLELRDILVFDTMLAEWVIAGNRSAADGWGLSLDDTAQRYGLGQKLSLAARLIHAGVDPSDIPRQWLEPYCYTDVDLCRRIYQKQMEILLRDGLLHLVLTRNLCCAALADIEFEGAELDKKRVQHEYDTSLELFRKADADLHELTGGINLSSPKQVGEYLYNVLKFKVPLDHKKNPIVTGKGVPKTDNATLSLLKADTPEQERFLALYRIRNRLDSLLTKNLEFFRLVCEQKNSVFYGVLNQGFTGTHRLSSSGRPVLFEGTKKPKGVQFQNLPREYKKLFTALDPDYVVGEADGAQLEFRVAADMGHDDVARKAIENGEDVHTDTATVFVNWNANNPNNPHKDFIGLTVKQGRQPAKPQTFKPMYGGNGVHPAEKEYCKFFKQKYAGIAGTQHEWCLEVLDRGYQINPYGMRFYWPGTRMSRSGYIDNTTSISNYSVQGFATAEIIPIALVYFWHRTRNLDITIWNTIHDSIACRIRRGLEGIFEIISKQCLTYDVYAWLFRIYKYEFSIPLGVGIKISEHWGEADVETVIDVWPDGREQRKVK